MSLPLPQENPDSAKKNRGLCPDMEGLRQEILRLRQENGELRAQVNSLVESGKCTGDSAERKSAQDSLRQSEAEFRAMFETASIGMAQANPHTRQWLRVNRKMCEITGYAAHELLDKKIPDLTHPDDQYLDGEMFDHVVRNDLPDYRLEKRYIRKDGTTAWVNVNMTVIRDAAGQPVRTMATIEDITERKRLEQSLWESENRLRFAMEGANDGIWDVQMKTGQVYLSPRGCEILGYEFDDLSAVNQVWSDLVHPDDLPRSRENLNAYLDGRKSLFEVEQRLRTKTGDWKWVLTRGKVVARDDQNKPLRMTGTHTDITERKRSDETLRRLNRELQAISECNQALIRATDERSLLNEVCRIICEAAGYTMAWVGFTEENEAKSVRPAAWSGVNDGYLESANITWADAERGHGPTGTCIRSGRSCYIQDFESNPRLSPWLEQSRKRGFRSSIGLPLLNESGIAFGALTIYSAQPNAFIVEEIRLLEELAGDLAYGILGLRARVERRRVEEERQKLQSQLSHSQKMEAIGQLAGGVAHDFNNVLAAMMMHLGFLQQNASFDHETQAALNEIMTEATRASNLTRQLLLFSRRSVMAIKVIDVEELVSSLLRMLRRLIGEHISLHLAHAAPSPQIEADPGMIEQVVMNLAVNARDAMPKGGSLSIGLNTINFCGERVKGSSELRTGQFVCLSVTDTGCGMDKATLERIFDPFFTTKEPGKGTGLGLATVQSVVAQHKGWVEVESEVGKGSTFRVFLPATSKTLTAGIQKGKPVSAAKGELILVVEDELALRQPVVKILKKLGYQVLQAGTGKEALEVWRGHHQEIDLLFTDMVMPGGMTGLELTEKLRAENPILKVIISSGYIPEVADRQNLAGNNIVYLQKPYEIESLSQIIRTRLARP